MALNIKNAEVEQLAADVARMARETKTEAIRRALIERKLRLQARPVHANRADRIKHYLERFIWPKLPNNVRGNALTKEEREEILGYGPHGV